MTTKSKSAEKLGVYVAVPFCRAKCSFCNFASGVGTAGAIERYVAMLCAEIDAAGATAEGFGAELPHIVDTVYFGGGTPSLLTPAQLREIFAALRRNFEVEQGAEITLESAPGQIAEESLDEALRLGVNRVSLGVQSFVDRESAAVGRTHTERECVSEIARLRAAGLREVGADLIAGLPYQTEASWGHSLEMAGGLAADGGLTHLSVYMLEIDEDSRLGREVMAGGQRFHAHGVPQDDLAAEMYEQACAALPEAGFAQYEISNFAASSSGTGECQSACHESRHNRKYWERAPYVGFGLDAHSMLEEEGPGSRTQGPEDGNGGGTGTRRAVRFANPEELREYAGAWSRRGLTRVDQRAAFEETLFLGLRMNEGVSVARLRERFARELVVGSEDAVAELAGEGLMRIEDGCWRLTLRGRLVSNDVFGRLLESAAVCCGALE